MIITLDPIIQPSCQIKSIRKMLTEAQIVIGSILVLVATLSNISSFLTLYLIHSIGRWNGFIVLIYSITVCQIIYDLSFYLIVDFSNNTVIDAIAFTTNIGGLSVTLWTNVISGIVWYIVSWHHIVNIWSIYKWLFSAIMSFCFAFAISQLTLPAYSTSFSVAYNVIRFSSIIFNLFIYLVVRMKLSRMATEKTAAAVALRELSSRLKYYPIVQVITRTPAVVYQFGYGFGTSAFSASGSASQTVALGFYGAFTPAAGIGYFLIFIFMQPHAKTHFVNLLRSLLPACCLSLCCIDPAKSSTGLLEDFNQNDRFSSGFRAESSTHELPPQRGVALNNAASFDIQQSGDFTTRDSNLNHNNAWICYDEMDEDELCLRVNSVDHQ